MGTRQKNRRTRPRLSIDLALQGEHAIIDPNLRFGIAIPQRFPGEIDVSVLPSFFAAVEELGYHSCWVVEQAINAHNDLAPIPLLSYAAALTDKALLGSSVLISVLRNPINLAKSLATLDRLSNGRLIAGVGMGNATGAPFSEAFGAPAAGKASRFEEGLVLMQRLWTGERVTFEGRFWQLNDSFISPTPTQPSIPLWFGGHAPAALDRAARLGDGWMGAGATSTARFRDEQEAMRTHLDAHRRDPATFTTSKRVFIGVEDDPETALRRMQPWFTMHSGSGQRAERVGVYGTPEQCAQGLSEIADTGLGLIALNPLYDHERQARRLANEVLPLMGLSL